MLLIPPFRGTRNNHWYSLYPLIIASCQEHLGEAETVQDRCRRILAKLAACLRRLFVGPTFLGNFVGSLSFFFVEVWRNIYRWWFVVDVCCFSPGFVWGKWSNLTSILFSNGLVQPPPIQFQLFQFSPDIGGKHGSILKMATQRYWLSRRQHAFGGKTPPATRKRSQIWPIGPDWMVWSCFGNLNKHTKSTKFSVYSLKMFKDVIFFKPPFLVSMILSKWIPGPSSLGCQFTIPSGHWHPDWKVLQKYIHIQVVPLPVVTL